MSIGLLIIDPQNDFHDIPADDSGNSPALAVPGACDDAGRLIDFLDRHGEDIDATYVTLDSHAEYDVGHPAFWLDDQGQHPSPFTEVKAADIKAGRFRPADDTLSDYVLAYAEALESQGRFTIMIWPTHCVVDSWGWQVYAPIKKELDDWEMIRGVPVTYKRKGTHFLTEHYAAFAAEFPLDDAPETQVDWHLLDTLAKHDQIVVSGQALSHCVGETLRQMTDLWPRSLCEKVVLLKDTTSPVPGFEDHAKSLAQQLEAKGVRLLSAGDWSAATD